MLVGDLPWPRVETLPDLARAVVSGRLYVPSHVSRGTRELLAGMLQINPSARWSLQRIKRRVRELSMNVRCRQRNLKRSMTENIYVRF